MALGNKLHRDLGLNFVRCKVSMVTMDCVRDVGYDSIRKNGLMNVL